MSEQGAPKCFSKEWDPKEPECAGGLDPAYTNDNRMSANYATHVRDRCVWFGACGAKTQALKMEGARGLITPDRLVGRTSVSREEMQDRDRAYWADKARRLEEDRIAAMRGQAPVKDAQYWKEYAEAREREAAMAAGWQPPAISQFAYSMATAQQKLEMDRHMREAEEMRRRGYGAMPGPMPYMPHGYQQMMPVNYQMPGYLTAQEPMYEGRSFWGMLGVTIVRSLAKSAGHSVAHVFDSVPWGSPPAPPWTPPKAPPKE